MRHQRRALEGPHRGRCRRRAREALRPRARGARLLAPPHGERAHDFEHRGARPEENLGEPVKRGNADHFRRWYKEAKAASVLVCITRQRTTPDARLINVSTSEGPLACALP